MPCPLGWWVRCSATASRCMAATGRPACRLSLPGGAATTPFRCCTCSPSMGPTQRSSAPTITAPWSSCTRRTSSLFASAGRPGGGAVPDPGLWNTACHDQQLPLRRLLRGRGVGLAENHRDSVGFLSRAPLRAHGGLRRGLDLGAFALLPRHPTGPEGGGTRAPP